MPTLPSELRKQLGKTVIAARRAAEVGTKAALDALAVPNAKAFPHMTPGDRELRNRLRAHARQLGDRRNQNETQGIERLVQECAYEHWHRMLFARFLAENDLLIEPESGVAISLDECEELARDRGVESWELAGQFAQRMLPEIFRPDDPALRLSLPREHRGKLETLLDELPADVFRADDSLGWVYQFWQAEKKDQINKSEKKIGADELPAVTQLFTEDYMVLFLLHNTLGAWWAGKVLADRPELASKAESEDDLRKACAVGEITWPYLRFVREDGEPWRPAAGTFEGWPEAVKDITVLDPCMGSGHFLVFALPILVAFRMAEEGLTREAAVEAVLRHNLFGLEIDQRCTQIAAFNLAFAAWRRVGYRPLPKLNLACSGLAIGVSKAEWLRLAEKAVTAADPAAKRDLLGVEENLLTAGLEARVKNSLEGLYDLFAKAPWLGSLVDPRRAGGDIFRADYAQLEPLIASILPAADTDEAVEMAVAAQGMAKAAELLAKRFMLVCTNVPYLGRGKQDEYLREYFERMHANAKSDLATCFVERCLSFCSEGGSAAVVTPQNWLFLGSYTKLRVALLKESSFNVVCDLGPAAFNEMNWWAARTALATLSKTSPLKESKYLAVSADTGRDLSRKLQVLASGEARSLTQSSQLLNPDSRISVYGYTAAQLLADYANVYVGFQNGDTPRWVQKYWEQKEVAGGWSVFQLTSENTTDFGGRHSIIKWDDGDGLLANSEQARLQGREAWGKSGVIVRQMRHLPAGLYLGDMYDQSSSVIVPKNEAHLLAIAAFVMSHDFHDSVRQIDPSVAVTNATFVKVPFDLTKWTEIAGEMFPGGLPKPFSDDPTQWLFGSHPQNSEAPLQVAAARLTGYRWPRQTGSKFPDCPAVGPDGLEEHADADGIVCIPAIRGEEPAGDRLGGLLAAAFGADWSPVKERQLIAATGSKAESLDEWLRTDFFAQHCALFHHRPFVWHVWDGRKDGFHALVNYHKLAEGGGKGRKLLEALTYSYLGDWIGRQKAAIGQGEAGADDRLAAAIELQKELEKIIEGEPPYDIFVRWKPLHEQPIGWEPDINDGVRLNIRSLMSSTLSRGRAGTGVLRAKPNVKWQKDRGKEPQRDRDDYPWFWNGETFTGERHNDRHFTNAEKRAAREKHGKGGK